MVESIVPGDSLAIRVEGVYVNIHVRRTETVKYPTIVIGGVSENIVGFLLITITSNYDNTTFDQTETLAENAVSVTPYGFIVYPITDAESYTAINIPVKCCGKYGSLDLTSEDITTMVENPTYFLKLVTLTDPGSIPGPGPIIPDPDPDTGPIG